MSTIQGTPTGLGPRATIYRAAPDGKVKRTDALECDAEQVVADAKSDRAYVLTPDAVLAVDHGARTATLALEAHGGTRCLAARPEGGLVLAEEQRLRFLDPDLHETGHRALDFRPREIEVRKDGSLLVSGNDFDDKFVHLSAGGRKTRFKSGNVRVGSEIPAADGSLWYVEDNGSASMFGGRSMVVHHYDPATRHDDRFSGGSDTSVAVPLPGDRQLLVQDRLADPQLELRADGFTRKTVSFGGDCHLRQLCVTADGKSAYVTVSRHPREKPTERTMYRVPLDDDGGGASLPFLFNPFMAAGAPDKQEIYHTASDHGNFIPAVLADGRIAILGQRGLELLDADGVSLGHFDDVAGLKAAIGSDVAVVSRRYDAGGGSESAIGEGWAAHLQAAAREKWIPAVPSAPTACTDDGVARFERTETEQQAAAELGPEVGAMLARMQSQAPSAELALLRRQEIPFGDGARVLAGTTDVRMVGADGRDEQPSLKLDQGAVTALLPLSGPGGHYLAAGTSTGDVLWLHGGDCDSGESSRFSLGEPVKGLALLPGDRVAALGDAGGVLVLDPGVKALAAPVTAPATKPPGTLVQKDDAVVINGVSVPKQPARTAC